jgi:fatty-acid desaturase
MRFSCVHAFFLLQHTSFLPPIPQASRRQFKECRRRLAGFVSHHLALLALPLFFSWGNVALAAVWIFLQGPLGVTISYHRQLTHKAFKSPKWLEYLLAIFAAGSLQGGPIEWVSDRKE